MRSLADFSFRSSCRSSVSAIDELATEFAKLPGIGRKTALRLTYHLLKQPTDQSRRLAQSLLALGERVRPCERCFNLTEEALCEANARADAGTGTQLDVLDAETSLTTARSTQVQALHDYDAARARFERAIGMDFSRPPMTKP